MEENIKKNISCFDYYRYCIAKPFKTNIYLHLEVEVVDGDVGQDGVGQHLAGILHRRLFRPTEKLLLSHLGGNKFKRLKQGKQIKKKLQNILLILAIFMIA